MWREQQAVEPDGDPDGAAAQAPARPGRPRDARAHQAIIDATLELLSADGYSKLTIESIANRAGVGKTTIYRRWPSKGPLVSEVISGLIHLGPMVDTGDTRKDLAIFLKAVLTAMSQPLVGGTIPGLANDMGSDPALAEPFRQFIIAPKRQRVNAILDRAVSRGEIDEDVDRELVMDLLVGPILWRALLTGAPLNIDVTQSIVDHVVRSIGLRPVPQNGEVPAPAGRSQR